MFKDWGLRDPLPVFDRGGIEAIHESDATRYDKPQ
jgi:hypothetical protein